MADPPYELDVPDVPKKRFKTAPAPAPAPESVIGHEARRVYTEDEVARLMKSAAEARERDRQNGSGGNGGGGSGDGDEDVISPRTVKQLQNTVGIFQALKDLSSNPIQKAIETKVGERAAVAVEQVFGPPQQTGKRDFIEMLFNSQFMFGLGNGLGQRAPELVERIGKEKTDSFIDSMIGAFAKKQGQGAGQGAIQGAGQVYQPQSGASGAQSGAQSGVQPLTPEEQRARQQAERDLVMQLDRNNPEHISAYAESQGGISIDVARKMLIIHQDDFYKQVEKTVGSEGAREMLPDGSEVSFKDKKSEVQAKKKIVTVAELPVVPDRWEGDEGLEPEARQGMKNVIQANKPKPPQNVEQEVDQNVELEEAQNVEFEEEQDVNQQNVELEEDPNVNVKQEEDTNSETKILQPQKVHEKPKKGSYGWIQEQKRKKLEEDKNKKLPNRDIAHKMLHPEED